MFGLIGNQTASVQAKKLFVLYSVTPIFLS